MKLTMEVRRFDDDTDSTWIESIPLEYDSIEKAKADLQALCQKNDRCGYFNFGKASFRKSDFHELGSYMEPLIYTLDQWFESNKICP